MNPTRQTLHLIICAAALVCVLFVLNGCATKQPEEVATDIREAKAWYCGTGMMGIRAVARFLIYLGTGATIPNACKVVDAVIDADQ